LFWREGAIGEISNDLQAFTMEPCSAKRRGKISNDLQASTMGGQRLARARELTNPQISKRLQASATRREPKRSRVARAELGSGAREIQPLDVNPLLFTMANPLCGMGNIPHARPRVTAPERLSTPVG
jgi:hypothetical protein